MERERILGLLGYDAAVVSRISEKNRSSIRGAATSWLIACLILGAAAGYAAWLILPGTMAPMLGGVGVTVLTVNLLRVVNAGGGCHLGRSLEESEQYCKTYRPSLIPALVFASLAVILAQPAQIPFSPEIEPRVEEHRQALIEQHNIAAALLGTDAEYYRAELQSAGFPIFRIGLIWEDPRRAARLTVLVLVLVLLPAIWSQLFAIDGLRAYQWERSKEAHREVARLQRESRASAQQILSGWSTYEPPDGKIFLGRSVS